MTLAQSDIDDLRAKLAKATPGEWFWLDHFTAIASRNGGFRKNRQGEEMYEMILWPNNSCPIPETDAQAIGACGDHSEPYAAVNAALIVAAKNALPALLDLASAAIAARERVMRECAVTLEKRAANHRDQVRYFVETGSPSLAAEYRMRATEAECCAAAILYPIPAQNGRDDA